MSEIISLSEVKKHKSDKSLWVVIHNDVYDVTPYLDEHPGGIEPLMEVAGKDATQDFEDVGHSADAREIMKKYKIGSLSSSEEIESAIKWSHSGCGSCSSASNCPGVKSKKSEEKIRRRDEPSSVRNTRGPPCEEGSSRLKWALLALAGAIVIGIIVKKYAT